MKKQYGTAAGRLKRAVAMGMVIVCLLALCACRTTEGAIVFEGGIGDGSGNGHEDHVHHAACEASDLAGSEGRSGRRGKRAGSDHYVARAGHYGRGQYGRG